MSNKIIKVGSSAAVTIPKKVLKSMSIDIGDNVFVSVDAKNRRFIIEPVVNFKLEEERALRIDEFIRRYKKDLEKVSE
ncbi:MAG TPA: AbrB/MazE/SpoVT family DNA-binding domain-containing protein [Patescibacteria group bacterium]|nr:AbrB/MazE/SpoVT family DNA-binding domain-containing protein [Patescibacteria group bacterium]